MKIIKAIMLVEQNKINVEEFKSIARSFLLITRLREQESLEHDVKEIKKYLKEKKKK